MGVNKTNQKVPRRESGDHIEVVLVGGNVSLAIPEDHDIFDVEPEEVDYETAKKNLLGTDYWRGIMMVPCAQSILSIFA